MKKVLIVGGGSVGQVYGHALSQAGAEVSFYLKENHAAQGRAGYTLYHLNKDKNKRTPLQLPVHSVLTRPEEVRATEWDQIYITTSSPALRTGWLKDFAAAARKTKAIITLQPGTYDREYLLQYFSENQLISGTISVIAYSTPLPGSDEKVSPPGTAYYFPPFSPSFLSGPEALTQEVARELSHGGIKSKYSPVPAGQKVAFAGALLITAISALEGAHWSLSQLKKPSELERLTQALGESSRVVSAQYKIRLPSMLKWISPFTLKFFLDAAPSVLPFELEPYLQVHFTKVREQTRLMMKEYIEFGKENELSVKTLQELEKRV